MVRGISTEFSGASAFAVYRNAISELPPQPDGRLRRHRPARRIDAWQTPRAAPRSSVSRPASLGSSPEALFATIRRRKIRCRFAE
jgi:hypothetical protein